MPMTSASSPVSPLLWLLLEARHLPQLLLASTATLIDNEPKGAAIIVAGRFGNFSGFQFLPFRIHQAPSAPLSMSSICPCTPHSQPPSLLYFFFSFSAPLLLFLLPLFSLGPGKAFVRRLLIREWSLTREVNHTQKSGNSVGASHVCMTERQKKDALWFSLVLSFPPSIPRPLLTHLLFFTWSKRKVSCVREHG